MQFNNDKFAKDLLTMDHEMMYSIIASSDHFSGSILLLSRSEGDVYTEAFIEDDNVTINEFNEIIKTRLAMVTERFKQALN